MKMQPIVQMECKLRGLMTMSEYLVDVKKFDSKADVTAVDKIAKRLALVMSKSDSRYVATSDPKEMELVQKKWAQEKLDADPEAAKIAVAYVAEQMKGERLKNRVTFYYLVAKKLGALSEV